jgi:hypothetical protein
MPQWRKLHVKAVESLDINDMPSDFERLLWVLLPLGLDREGRGLDNPSWIKSKIMPLRLDVTIDMVSQAMNWYEERGMIVRYEVNERRYFYVPTFSRYQSTDREAPSDFPAPLAEEPEESEDEETPEQLGSSSRASHEQVVSGSGLDIDEEEDIDREYSAAPPAVPPPPDKPKRKPSEKELKRWALRDELQRHFLIKTGLPAPRTDTQRQIKETQTLWWSPLDEIGDLAGGSADAGKVLIEGALERLQDVTVANPNSIIKTVRAVYADKSRPSATAYAAVEWS